MLQSDFAQMSIKNLSMDKDGMAQELRNRIIKAAKLFDPNRTYKTKGGEEKKVLFHTYLHWAMRNTIYTLISKEKKRKKDGYGGYMKELTLDQAIPFKSAEGRNSQPHMRGKFQSLELEDTRSVSSFEEIEMNDIIEKLKLNAKELKFIELRQDGMTMEEISNDLGINAYKIRQTLRGKFWDKSFLFEDGELKI